MSIEDEKKSLANDNVTQAVISSSITEQNLSFRDRFGELGSLVGDDHKMIQWNASFGVEK